MIIWAAAVAGIGISDSPPRKPSLVALARSITTFTRRPVAATDVRNVICEGLWYDLPGAPMNYACKWDQKFGRSWRSYSAHFNFRNRSWALTENPTTDIPANPASSEEMKLREWLIPHLRHELVEDEEPHKLAAEYGYVMVDLNDDGHKEAIVWLTTEQECGSGGCTMEVEEQHNGHWRVLSETARTRPPIQILPTKHYGWHDIGVFDQGGGINPGFESLVRFTGLGYDGSPLDVPLSKHVRGRTVLTAEQTYRPVF